MNWYRVTLAKLGVRLPPVDVAGHSAGDAVYCAAVKLRLNDAGPDEAQLVDIDCIVDPEHARNLSRLRQHAMRGVAELAERIQEVSRNPGGKPAGGR